MLDIVVLHYCGTRLRCFPWKSLVFCLSLWCPIWVLDIRSVLSLLAVGNCNSFQYCMTSGMSVQLSFLIICLQVASQSLILKTPAQSLVEDSKRPPCTFLCILLCPPLCYSVPTDSSCCSSSKPKFPFSHLIKPVLPVSATICGLEGAPRQKAGMDIELTMFPFFWRSLRISSTVWDLSRGGR